MIRLHGHGGSTHVVLQVGGTAASAETFRTALADASHPLYDIEWVATVTESLPHLASNRIRAVLLRLDQPEASVRGALDRILRAKPNVPTVIIGTEDDEKLAGRFIKAGAVDYVVAERLDSYWLPRLLRHTLDCDETGMFELMLDSIGDGLVSIDATDHICYLNRTAEDLTGWSRGDAIGRVWQDVVRLVESSSHAAISHLTMGGISGSDAPKTAEPCILLRRDGSEAAIEHRALPVVNRLGLATGRAIVLRDVSAAQMLTSQMSHLASHDPLTALPNRTLLRDRLGRAIALAHRHHRRLAVLYLDIDHFKLVNDSLGHQIGDDLLRAVARDVTMCVRSSDTVSRDGGDEFVVVLAELQHVEDAAVGARKIIAAVNGLRMLGGHELQVTGSIGISVYPGDGEDAETLLKNADMALYDAKAHGRDCYRFFGPALNERAVERQAIGAGLRTALDQNQFKLFYQPMVDLQTREVVRVEALIRWQHPNRGLIGPIHFIPIAEECGLIKPIGRWVVHEACRQARAWQDAGLRSIPVSINVSSIEFRSKDFVPNIADALSATGVDPWCLEIELTESVLMADVGATQVLLRTLKTLGIRLAIDDFGTGWSSLSYLRQFPIDVLKIDKSFVQEITPTVSVAPIVSAVIHMAKSLKHRVVAEGIETPEQLAFLQSAGCDEGQGYYFSRPMPARQFALELALPVRRGNGAEERSASFLEWRLAFQATRIDLGEMTGNSKKPAPGIVALFNASDDTIDMMQKLLAETDDEQRFIWCRFSDLKKGIIDFDTYMDRHNPEVVIFDLSPPYDENWTFFKAMRDSRTMEGRGLVLTTTNKNRLDEVLGQDSHALEVVGQPEDLGQIVAAIQAEGQKARASHGGVRRDLESTTL